MYKDYTRAGNKGSRVLKKGHQGCIVMMVVQETHTLGEFVRRTFPLGMCMCVNDPGTLVGCWLSNEYTERGINTHTHARARARTVLFK